MSEAINTREILQLIAQGSDLLALEQFLVKYRARKQSTGSGLAFCLCSFIFTPPYIPARCRRQKARPDPFNLLVDNQPDAPVDLGNTTGLKVKL